MGTTLGVTFIAAAAAIGVLVGLRPTVIDGRPIAAEIEKQVAAQGIAVECDREIRLGVEGAAFVCVLSRGGARARVDYVMSRDGSYAPRDRVPPLPGVDQAEE